MSAGRNDFTWPDGCEGAVSLTYDDGLVCHHQFVGPAMSDCGLCGTFYPTGSVLLGGADLRPWRLLADAGHELGNHSLFHPCRGGQARTAGWLKYDLREYTPSRWREEMLAANGLLKIIDGLDERTFGNTCHDNAIGPDIEPVCLEPMISEMFLAARGEVRGPVHPANVNFSNLGTVSGDGQSFDQWREQIEQAVGQGMWLIFCFHGVGEETHKLFSVPGEQEKLYAWLTDRREQIWTAPVREIARYLRNGEPSQEPDPAGG